MNTTVLLIDARPASLGSRRELLENAGYRVVSAEDANSGLAAFERYDPRVVIVDSKLPGRPSTALCRELRAIERQKGRPTALVMLSRGGGKKNRRTAGEASRVCDSVLREPADDGLLLSTLGRFASPVRVSVEGVDLPPTGDPPPARAGAIEREIDSQLDALIGAADLDPAAGAVAPAGACGSATVGAEEAALLDEVVDELLHDDNTRPAEPVRDPCVGTTRGDLETLEPGEIVQMLALGGKTARVRLRSADGRPGEVWFDGGRIVHARRGRTSGEQAFFEMVSWTRGDFIIEHGLRPESRSLDHDAMYLVMEGMRRVDESRRGGPAAAVDTAATRSHHSERDVLPAAARPDSFPWRGLVLVTTLLGAAAVAWRLLAG